MLDFTFWNPTRIHFGRNALSKLPDEVRLYGQRVLLVYGGGSIKRSGLYQKVMDLLGEAQAHVWELAGVQPNPRLSLVREGISICREQRIQLVLAVGGGSVLDTGKAIANGCCYDGDTWDLFCGKAANTAVLPLGTIITIAAAGSEMSNSCVITNEEDNCKRGRNTPLNFPKFSILDPELTYTLPPYQTACGAVDIIAHMMERYFTQVHNTELIDGMIETMMRTVIRNASIVMEKPDNYDARAEIMWAGALAHNSLLGTGRVEDWSSHKLEHELSALYDIAHGGGLAIVIPAWMTYVLPRGGAWRLAQFARNVMDVPADFGTEEEIATEGINRLRNFYRSLNLPTTLTEIGIDDRDFDRMALRASTMTGEKTLGNYVPLTAEDCKAVYQLMQ